MNDEVLLKVGFIPSELPLARLFFETFTLNDKGEWIHK